jgi:hypothetical protein
MTPEEYLEKKRKNQEQLDKEFDDAIKKSYKQQLDNDKEKTKSNKIVELIKTLYDLEDETTIMSDLMVKYQDSSTHTKEEINRLKSDLRAAKMKKTKIETEIENL